jgi:hypothetical protein
LTYFCCIFIIIGVVTFIICFDWQSEPIDGRAVYASGGRRAYGW